MCKVLQAMLCYGNRDFCFGHASIKKFSVSLIAVNGKKLGDITLCSARQPFLCTDTHKGGEVIAQSQCINKSDLQSVDSGYFPIPIY